MRTKRIISLVAIVMLTLSACGQDSDDTTPSANTGDDQLSVERVEMAMDNDYFMNQLAWAVADELFWPELGFTEPANVVSSEEWVSGLLGGSVWVGQGETAQVWAANSEGADLVLVGIEKKVTTYIIGVREGISSLDDLAGKKVSAGPPGDPNVAAAKAAVAEAGGDPDTIDWVSVAGGSDERLQALLAGQVEGALLQPRHRAPLEKAGGSFLLEDLQEEPSEIYAVRRDFLEENQPAVVAFLRGRIQAKQWAEEGACPEASGSELPPNTPVNLDQGIEIVRERGVDVPEEPTPEEANNAVDWSLQACRDWAIDAGIDADALDAYKEFLAGVDQIPSDFEWRDHADFEALWAAQEAEDLPRNPDPSEI